MLHTAFLSPQSFHLAYGLRQPKASHGKTGIVIRNYYTPSPVSVGRRLASRYSRGDIPVMRLNTREK